MKQLPLSISMGTASDTDRLIDKGPISGPGPGYCQLLYL